MFKYVSLKALMIFRFYVPYWFVNKSGIPLIVKQEAADGIAAGQMVEHESAKDRNPLMFSFADDDCPKQLNFSFLLLSYCLAI